MRITRESVAVELEHIGEGYNGDHDEDDPNDAALLRFTVTHNGEEVPDGSFCTNLPGDTSDEVQRQFCEHVMANVYDAVMKSESIDRICQQLSWASPANPMPDVTVPE